MAKRRVKKYIVDRKYDDDERLLLLPKYVWVEVEEPEAEEDNETDEQESTLKFIREFIEFLVLPLLYGAHLALAGILS